VLTPRDIHEAEFKRVWKGYNPEEVDAFLQRVVSAYESVFKENERLKQRIQELEARVQEYSRTETQIDELLALAKKTAADVKEAAEKQAAILVDEAKAKAREIVAQAQERAQKDSALLERMRAEAGQFRDAVERAAEEYLASLDRLLASIERLGENAAPRFVAAALDEGDGPDPES